VNEQTEAVHSRVDVVICGMGPTGLLLALLLGKQGLQVVVLEQDLQPSGQSRAVHTDGECLRIFQSVGLADRLVENMLTDVPVRLVSATGQALAEVRDPRKTYGWPDSNFFHQGFLEIELQKSLSQIPNVQLRRGLAVTFFSQTAENVLIEFRRHRDPHSPLESLQARFLVGCDGGRSTVRELMGAKLVGRNFADPWLVLDLSIKPGAQLLVDWPHFNFILDPLGPAVSCSLPHGQHRFEFQLQANEVPAAARGDKVAQLISRFVDPGMVEVVRSVVYQFNALIADRWQDRRVFLAGDAAHMSPPFVGQGLSSGFRDAANLAWKLTAVVRGQWTNRILRSYQFEREPHAQAMIQMAVLVGGLVSIHNRLLAWCRNWLLRSFVRLPVLGPFVREIRFKPAPRFKGTSFFGLKPRHKQDLAGHLLPQPQVIDQTGQCQRLDDLLGGGFALLGDAVDPREGLTPHDLSFWTDRGTRFLILNPPAGLRHDPSAVVIEDPALVLQRWLRSFKSNNFGVAIIRPDRYLFGVVQVSDLAEATEAIRSWR